MKRKINKIKNKRLVMGGGINNLSPNEILVEQKGDTISLKEKVNGEIKEVSGSGSSNEGEGSNIEYLDASGVSGLDRVDIGMYSLALKGLFQGMQMAGMPTNAYFTGQGKVEDITACMIDFSLEIKSVVDGSIMTMTIGEIFKQNGTDIDSIPRLTKEQFYSLE